MDLFEILQGAYEKNSPFDDYVPIIQSKDGRITTVYLTDGISYPSEYNKLCYILDHAKPGDTVTLHINNGGGHIDSAFQIINSMKHSKAHIIGKLSGTVASASTVISLCCHELIVADYTAFMIHNYSGGVVGKGNEIKAKQDFVDRELNVAFKEIYSGFLTDREMTQVIDGRDIWLGKSEVLSRWNSKITGTVITSKEASTPSISRRGRPSRKVS